MGVAGAGGQVVSGWGISSKSAWNDIIPVTFQNHIKDNSGLVLINWNSRATPVNTIDLSPWELHSSSQGENLKGRAMLRFSLQLFSLPGTATTAPGPDFCPATSLTAFKPCCDLAFWMRPVLTTFY